jgi:hypothetical protein
MKARPAMLTDLQPEEYAYPHGGQTRKGRAFYPDGIIRRVWAGIPDTFFSIPAHGRLSGRYVRGFLTCEGDAHNLVFHIAAAAQDDPAQGSVP